MNGDYGYYGGYYGGGYGLYFDPLYFLVIIMFVLALLAQWRVKRTYSKYSRVVSSRGLTAERAVQMVLNHYGVTGVQITRIRGHLTDNFNPSTNIISLSESVYGSTSIAAIGVACHEAGHAVQHAVGYVPIKLRNSVVPACNIGSALGLPIAFVGLFIGSQTLVNIGLILYGIIALFQLLTLPVELNASRRALAVMRDADILSDDERRGARKVLTAAAMTYVVALATALVNLLRMIVIFGGFRGRDDD